MKEWKREKGKEVRAFEGRWKRWNEGEVETERR